tara:strand:+ start:1427 stop:1978 length:552 start_codon:yes stop_codon:yes gene_type:complete
MLSNYNVQYKKLNELKNKRKENVSIVFFINTKTKFDQINYLTENDLLITNTQDDINFSKLNLFYLKKPIYPKKIRTYIDKFMSKKRMDFEDIYILDKKIFNRHNGIYCSLTDIEDQIIIYLINNTFCSKEHIKQKILKIKSSIETNSLESHLTRIRKKLNKINTSLVIKSKSDTISIYLHQKK